MWSCWENVIKYCSNVYQAKTFNALAVGCTTPSDPLLSPIQPMVIEGYKGFNYTIFA